MNRNAEPLYGRHGRFDTDAPARVRRLSHLAWLAHGPAAAG